MVSGFCGDSVWALGSLMILCGLCGDYVWVLGPHCVQGFFAGISTNFLLDSGLCVDSV